MPSSPAVGPGSVRMWWVPRLTGCMPVITALRDGAHTGAVVNAFVHSAPSAASRSRFGVRATGSP